MRRGLARQPGQELGQRPDLVADPDDDAGPHGRGRLRVAPPSRPQEVLDVRPHRTNGVAGAPDGRLVKQLSDHTTQLVHAEVELAKAELAAKGKQAGIGAGMFGGAGVFGLYGVGALTAFFIALLATAVAAAQAKLHVGIPELGPRRAAGLGHRSARAAVDEFAVDGQTVRRRRVEERVLTVG